jgi:hypothetical protein
MIRMPLGTAALASCGLVFALIAACSAPQALGIGEDNNNSPSAPGSGASSPSGGKDSETTKNGLPCSVDEFLKKRCQACHSSEPKAGASTSLVTHADFQKKHGNANVIDLVKDRIHSEDRPMPPGLRLGAVDTKAIDDWIAAGAKPSDETCNGRVPDGEAKPLRCDAPATKKLIKAGKPFHWDPKGKQDQYVCFGVESVAQTKRHIIGFGPKVDNKRILHHILVFQSQEAVSPEPTPCTAVTSAKWKLITGWAPGGGNYEIPPEAGFPENPGTTHWVFQMHYNNAANVPDATDDSGYELCSTEQLRPNDAGVMAPGSVNFSIPPRTASYTLKCDYKLGARYQGVTIFGASPHMHTHGIALSTERIPNGTGTPEMIFEQKPFNFENQENFRLDPFKKVAPGDVLRTRCSFKNTGDTAVTWGEGTGEEMCFNFFAYYPAIPDIALGPIPIQTWVTPSAFADCQPE